MRCAVRERIRRGRGRARCQSEMTDGGSQAARSRTSGPALARSEACTRAILAAAESAGSGESAFCAGPRRRPGGRIAHVQSPRSARPRPAALAHPRRRVPPTPPRHATAPRNAAASRSLRAPRRSPWPSPACPPRPAGPFLPWRRDSRGPPSSACGAARRCAPAAGRPPAVPAAAPHQRRTTPVPPACPRAPACRPRAPEPCRGPGTVPGWNRPRGSGRRCVRWCWRRWARRPPWRRPERGRGTASAQTRPSRRPGSRAPARHGRPGHRPRTPEADLGPRPPPWPRWGVPGRQPTAILLGMPSSLAMTAMAEAK